MRTLALALFFFTWLGAPALATEIAYDASGERRDPFLPLIGPHAVKVEKINTGDLVVEGIILDPSGDSLVLINGEFYKEGALVKDVIIEKIMRNHVVLKQDDQQKILWLREEEPEGEMIHETQ